MRTHTLHTCTHTHTHTHTPHRVSSSLSRSLGGIKGSLLEVLTSRLANAPVELIQMLAQKRAGIQRAGWRMSKFTEEKETEEWWKVICRRKSRRTIECDCEDRKGGKVTFVDHFDQLARQVLYTLLITLLTNVISLKSFWGRYYHSLQTRRLKLRGHKWYTLD